MPPQGRFHSTDFQRLPVRVSCVSATLHPQAASQVSPEFAEQLRLQVMGQVEAAALVAAAAGKPFDLASQVQQMLPALAHQVQTVTHITVAAL
jgi:hypothetical protein